jgi:anti-sigma28 factor (negative regulator of flagellin synthesis)
VDLSSTLGNLSRALSSFHSSRAERVQSLASQYQSGQYKVDPAAVSHSIVGAAIASGPSGGGAAASGAGK